MELRPDERALLRALLDPDDEVAARSWWEWRHAVDLDEVDQASQRLLPQVARRLGTIAPDDPARARIRGLHRHAWVTNQCLLRTAAGAAHDLQAAGIPVVALKGVAWSGIDARWSDRPMHDADLLVPIRRAVLAIDALLATGYRAQWDMSVPGLRSRVIERRHSWNFTRDESERVDLHWRVFEAPVTRTAERAAMRAAVPVRFFDTELRRLSDVDVLLHVVEHAAHREASSRLQWIVDLHRLLPLVGTALGAEGIARRAARFGLGELLSDGIRAAGSVVTLEGGAELASRLRETRNRTPRTRPRMRQTIESARVRRRWVRVVFLASGRSRRVETALLRLGPQSAPIGPTEPIALDTWLDFTDPAVADAYCGPGWAWTTPSHTWSDGRDARLVLPIPGAQAGQALRLEIDFEVDHYNESPNRRVILKVNGRPAYDIVAGTSPVVIEVPEHVARWCGPIELSIDVPGAVSFAERDGTNDRRRLGLPIRRIKVSVATGAE